MGTEEILRYFFSGGLVVATITLMVQARSAARQRELAHIQDQLRLLYAPLHCLTRQYMETIKRAVKLQDALNQGIKVGPHELEIPPPRGAEADKFIGLSNAYAVKSKETNARIRKLLEDNWNLIDLEDVEPFLTFLDDCARMQVEVDEKHGDGIAYRVNEHLGNIHYVRPGFEERVTAQFNAKRERLGELLMSRWWPWWRRRGSRKAP